MIDRRMFMVQAAALPFAWKQDASVIEAALAHAKRTGRWAVVLVAPAETRARFAFGNALWSLTHDAEAQNLFCQAVFAVVMPDVAKGRFDGNRALYAPDGKLLASDRVAQDVCASGAAFGTSFRAFIHGEKGERLAERAKAIEAGLPAATKALAARMGDVDVRRDLAPRIEELTPWIASLPGSKGMLATYYAGLPPAAPGTRVPYGCSLPEDEDPCETCGMAEVDNRSLLFLRILTGNKKLDALLPD